VVNRKFILVNAISKLSAYDEEFSATARRRGPNGNTQPPDPAAVGAHQKVLKDMVIFSGLYEQLRQVK
jgi:hypothetical protein